MRMISAVESEYGKCKTVTARFWPWFQVKVLKTFQLVPLDVKSVALRYAMTGLLGR